MNIKYILPRIGLAAALLAAVLFLRDPSTPPNSMLTASNRSETPSPALSSLIPEAESATKASVAQKPSSSAPVSPASRREIIASAWESPRPEFAPFKQWTEDFLAGPRRELISEGIEEAKGRRTALANLIRSDPEAALASAVPHSIRSRLPSEITAYLEEPVSAYGTLSLVAATPAPGRSIAEPLTRSALLDGREYRVFTYGRRAKLATLSNVSIVGIAVDNILAVSDSPVRWLQADELIESSVAEPVCGISGNIVSFVPTAAAESTAQALEEGGMVRLFCEREHAAAYETQLIANEGNVTSLAAGRAGSSNIAGRPSREWTHGAKKLLIIRADFSDLRGRPTNLWDNAIITEEVAVDRINGPGELREFIERNSYGKSSITIAPIVNGNSPDVTSILRMPRSAAHYATNDYYLTLHEDARKAAQGGGYRLDRYHRIGVVFSYLGDLPNSKMEFAGRGTLIGTNFWINGYYEDWVLAHEVGHTYGLQHANVWQVSDGNPVSPQGSSSEYGDPFDVMGQGRLDFSHLNKSLLQWIPDTAVTTATMSGVYRLFRHDHPAVKLSNTLALKIAGDASRDYWIGYRRDRGTVTKQEGADVLWAYRENRDVDLLDLTTPGKDASDAALAVKAAFSDIENGISVRVAGQGGAEPHEYLDIEIHVPVRPVSPEYEAVTLAGMPGQSGIVDGVGRNARFNFPRGVGTDRAGNIYVADTASSRVRKITPDGTVSTVTGDFGSPKSIAADGTGNVYIGAGGQIQKISPNGSVSMFASGSFDPNGLAADASGTVYAADYTRILKFSPSGAMTVIAGSASVGSKDGQGTNAAFENPRGLCLDNAGNIFVADSYNSAIRKVSLSGMVTTWAGKLDSWGSVDGLGDAARFSCPSGIEADAEGHLYVVDAGFFPSGNNTIRKISPSRVVTTILGTASWSGGADGIGEVARFTDSGQIARGPAGIFYLADAGNHTIRMLRPVVPARPSLQIAQVGSGIDVSWPLSVEAFRLETASQLPFSAWQTDALLPLVINGQCLVPKAPSASSGFYRLRKLP